MEPSLREGQTIVVLRKKWDSRPIAPGDILVYTSPEDNKKVVKRCVLGPGEQIDIRYGWLHTSQGVFYLAPEQKKQFKGMVRVPENHLFTVGDNPSRSVDSRTYGTIPLEKIEGRVIFPRNRGIR